MNRNLLVLGAAVIGAVALFAIGTRVVSDTNFADPHGDERTERITSLLEQVDQTPVDETCRDTIRSAGIECIDHCLPNAYALRTHIHPGEDVCEIVDCLCFDENGLVE